jgi:hypothetical protein
VNGGRKNVVMAREGEERRKRKDPHRCGLERFGGVKVPLCGR